MKLWHRRQYEPTVIQFGLVTYVHEDVAQFVYGEVTLGEWRVWELYFWRWALIIEPGRISADVVTPKEKQ